MRVVVVGHICVARAFDYMSGRFGICPTWLATILSLFGKKIGSALFIGFVSVNGTVKVP